MENQNRRTFFKAGTIFGATVMAAPMVNLLPSTANTWSPKEGYNKGAKVTKLAHLQENLWAADIEFTPAELKIFTEEIEKIPITGARYPTVPK